MLNEFFLVLLLAHIIGDFYAQTNGIAQKKKSCIKWVIIHGICYWAVTLIIFIPVMSNRVMLYGSLSAAAHMVIDLLKYLFFCAKPIRKTVSPKRETVIFIADQIMHLLSIAIIAYLFTSGGHKMIVSGFFQKLLPNASISFIKWAIALLLLHKPANVLISQLLILYRPDNKEEGESSYDKNAGRFIGTLERAIIILLIHLQQYSAIGLVLTAKSIARYDRITKDPAFSEYYLLGTLLSAITVIVISFIL